MEQVRLLDIIDMLAAAQEGCERKLALRQKFVEARGRNEGGHAFDAEAGGLVQAAVDVDELRNLVRPQPEGL